MKKNILLTAIVSILMIFAFVSCSENIAAPEDKLGTISFGDDSRAVTTVVEYSSEVEDLVWFYRATKQDDGYTTGETDGKFLAVAKADSGTNDNTTYTPTKGLSGKTLDANFSYGLWDIELQGYKYETEEGGTKNVTVSGDGIVSINEGANPEYTSTISNHLVDKSKTYATAKIEVGENAETVIEFGEISFKADNITADSSFTLSVTDKSGKGTVTVPESYSKDSKTVTNPTVANKSVTFGGLTYTESEEKDAVITGDHEMKFVLSQTLSGDGNTTIDAAVYTLEFTVKRGTKTTIAGTLIKNDNKGTIEVSGVQDVEPITLKKSIKVKSIDTSSTEGTAEVDGEDGYTVTIGNMTVKLPKDTKIAVTSDSVAKDSSNSSSGTADGTFGFQQKSSTASSISIETGETATPYELTLPVSTTNSSTLVTVKNFVGKDLSITKIYHGDTKIDAETSETVPTDKKEGYYYNSETGYLTLYIFHASEFNIVTRKAVAKIGSTSYYTFESALKAAAKAETEAAITLADDVEVKTAVEFSKSVTIDLNGNTLNFAVTTSKNNHGAFELSSAKVAKNGTAPAYTVTIKNGNIKGTMTGTKTNVFTIHSNAKLALDSVNMDVTSNRGIQIHPNSESASLEIKNNSEIKVNGWYAVATEATVVNNKTSDKVDLTITNSTLRVLSNNDDNTGLLLNVPGTYTIENTSVSGARQGAILRGGAYEISNSTFEYTTNNNENKNIVDWKNGNAVPNAAIVIGNRGNIAYAYPTKVNFSGTNTLVVPTDGDYQLYVYQADKQDGEADNLRKVTVKGNIDTKWTVNSDRNGADYPTAKINNTTYSTLQAAIDAAKNEETVILLCDTSGSGLQSGDTQATETRAITIDFGNHIYTMDSNSVGSSETQTQAMHWGESLTGLTLKNGTFAVSKSAGASNGKDVRKNFNMAMQCYIPLTAENMTFDLANVPNEKYDNTYDEKYIGKDKPHFNCYDTTTFTNCTITLNTENDYGLLAGEYKAAEGEVTLDNTKLTGNASFETVEKGSITLKNGSKVTGEVVSYFAGYSVNSETVNGVTTYTLTENE